MLLSVLIKYCGVLVFVCGVLVFVCGVNVVSLHTAKNMRFCLIRSTLCVDCHTCIFYNK